MLNLNLNKKDIIMRLITLILISCIFANAQINTEKYRPQQDSTGFSWQSEVGFKLQKGNVDFQELSIENLAAWLYPSNKILFIISGDLGWEDGKRFSNEMLAHLRNVYNLSKAWQAEFFVQTDYNKSRLLDQRFVIGSGLRFRAMGIKKEGLWLGSAVMFEQEDYDLPAQAKHPQSTKTWRLSSYMSFITNLKEYIAFNGVVYFQPAFKNFDDFKLVAESGLIVKVSAHFSLTTVFKYRFDQKPPDNIKKNDFLTESGLRFSF